MIEDDDAPDIEIHPKNKSMDAKLWEQVEAFNIAAIANV